jgi:hypothetical protein
MLVSTGAMAQTARPLDPLESAIEQQMKARAPNAVRMVPFWRGAAPKLDWMVPLKGGKCYAFAGAGSAGTTRLALYLWGPDGRRITEVKPWSPWATLATCVPWSGQYHVQAKLDGVGVFAVGLYDTGGPIAATPAPVYAAPAPAYGVAVGVGGVTVGVGGVAVSVGAAPVAAPAYPGAPPPDCRMGTDGINSCGYNCRMGTDGHMYCASRPDAQCAFNTDGTFTCP